MDKFNSNIIELGLFETSKSNCFSISTISLPDNLTNDLSKSKEFSEYDSRIFGFFQWNSNLHCLVRLKLHYRLDVLHVKNYFIDVIVLVNGVDSKLIDISKPIFFSNSSNYEEYFGIEPYWIFSLDQEKNPIIKIFNELSL